MSRACREAVRSTLYIRAEPRQNPFFRRGGEDYFPEMWDSLQGWNDILISKELERVLNVSVKTIRSDLEGLVSLGLLDRVPMNKRLIGYTKGSSFESKMKGIRGN